MAAKDKELVLQELSYKNKKILIFDEATSALDNSTEFKVMNSINKLNRDLTFILVAHRISSLKDCDRILKLENGKLIS